MNSASPLNAPAAVRNAYFAHLEIEHFKSKTVLDLTDSHDWAKAHALRQATRRATSDQRQKIN
jgi:hypothetical protein